MENNKMLDYFDLKLFQIVSYRKDVTIFKPRIVFRDEKVVKFGMIKHYGVLVISIDNFF